ncbi:MAG: Pterin-binding protein [Dehalococcoidia bacterium]|nr:Pterin-binding protein [Dehalococcoidia bacterium]
MLAIGESIHVISPKVRTAIESRDKAFIQELALRQVKCGANILDLNIGPRKKDGAEVMNWIVNTVQEVTNTPLSLDTTNPVAMEAGLKVAVAQPLINSTDATPERLNALVPLAAKYNANIIALTLAATGLPTTADARIELASENIFPICAQHGVPNEHIYLDPLVLTVNGNQDQAMNTVDAVRFFKQMSDPPPMTTCGLSNISNGAPNELRPLINRVFMIMLIGAGLDSAIVDATDKDLMEALRILEKRDDSTPKGKVYLSLSDSYAAGGRFDESGVNMSNPEISDIVKTIRMLEGQTLYAHSYLKL